MQTIQQTLSGWIDRFGEWPVGMAATIAAVAVIVTIWYLVVERGERASEPDGK
jgi:ABC-type spermidine/putrescine transport system permease subunit I